MRRYDLTRLAQQDVLSLFEQANSYSADAEERYADALVSCFERVADFPLSGRDRSDLVEDLRSALIRRPRLVVFYVVLGSDGDRVRITRVLRQERDVGASDFR